MSLDGPSIDGQCCLFNKSSGNQQHVMKDLGVVVTVTSSHITQGGEVCASVNVDGG